MKVRSGLPTFIRLTIAKVHDVHIPDALNLEAGAFYQVNCGIWTSPGRNATGRSHPEIRPVRLCAGGTNTPAPGA